jgi:ribose-phosphate pyrophosphokinase
MTTLNLLDPIASAIKYNILTFPDGEPHLKLFGQEDWRGEEVSIVCSIKNPSELMQLWMAADIIHHNCCRIDSIFITYLMGARMDRRTTIHQPFTLKFVAGVINSLNAYNVNVFHPHSHVAGELIWELKEFSNSAFITQVFKEINDASLIYVVPDQGATSMVTRLAALHMRDIVYGKKRRNSLTGALEGFEVNIGDVDIKDRPCMIIDDLCDGGGTFLGLAAVLKEKGAGDLYLAVSHGIFSKGITELTRVFKQVFTTNSYTAMQSGDGLTVIPL